MHIEYFRKLYFLVGPIPWLSDVILNVQNIKQLNNFTGYYVCSLHMNLLVLNPTPKHRPIPSSYHVCISAPVILLYHSCCRPYKLEPHLLPTSSAFATSPSLHLRLIHTTVPKQIPLYNLPYSMLPPVAFS